MQQVSYDLTLRSPSLMFITGVPDLLEIDILGSLLAAQTHLDAPLRQILLTHPAMTMEVAQILVHLYIRRCVSLRTASTPPLDFVTFKELQNSLLVQQPLLSKRLSHAQHFKWIENLSHRELDPELPPEQLAGYRGKSRLIRISDAGVQLVRPIWERYCKLARMVLANVPPDELRVYLKINVLIQDRIAPRWD